MNESDKRLQYLLEHLLRITSPLADEASIHDGKFLNVLLGIYRVSFSTLREIYYLSLNELTGSGALDLTRKVIEHGVAVEYMLLKGKEKMAQRFQDYMWVQAHEEIEFYKSIGITPDDWNDELRTGATEAERKYSALDSGIKKDKSWAGGDIGCKGMLRELKNSEALGEFDASRLLRAYIIGCRLNHPNPFTVQHYLGQEDYREADEIYRRQAIFMAISMHIRLTTRYIDEIRLVQADAYPDLPDVVHKVFDELNTFLETTTSKK